MKPTRTRGPKVFQSAQAANPLALTLQKALQHHQANELQEAEILYRQILKVRPDFPDALHLLGFLFHARNQNEEAIKWVKKAIAAAPKQPLYHTNLGTIYSAMGQQQEAIDCYRKALAINPNYVNALCNMGNALKEQGKLEEAIACHRKALVSQPDFYEVHNNLGIVLQESGRLEEAIACYQKALELKPDYEVAFNNMGYALQKTGKLEEAITCYRKALELKPIYHEAYNNLGNAFLAKGEYEEASVCYNNALAIRPNYQDALSNMGNLLREQGKLDEAIACYQRAVEIAPNLYDAHNNMGNAYQKAGKKREAIDCYRRALAIKPTGHGAYNNLGFVLQSVGEMEEAAICYKKAMELKPNDPSACSIVLHQMQWLCDWAEYQTLYEHMIATFHASEKSVNPFTFILLPTTAAEQKRCAELYVQEKYPAQRDLAATRYYPPNPDRIKIGYLSCDFQNHATSLLMAELFELHDHNRFEIKAYSYGPDDGQEMRQRIVAACDTFTDIYAASHMEAAQRILDDGVHILIEMKGFTNNTRMEIAALRPAPILASWLGYPGTSGAPFIDYILTDPFVTPPGFESHFTEKVVRLPGCYQPNDRKRAISARQPTRQEYGLPEQGLIFASFNKSYKITPELFDVWMRLLQQTPASILWLWEANDSVMRNLRREAEARGVAGSRIHFAGYEPITEHLARYRLVDLALDPFPCTSHTTGSDALWGGCPLVTCAGEPFASRVAGSLLLNVGLPELITDTPAEYEALALELAHNPEHLAAIRHRLQENLATAPLFDSLRYTMGLEAAFEAMWHRYQIKLPPDHIDVQLADTADGTQPIRGLPVKPRQQTTTPHHSAGGDNAQVVAPDPTPPDAIAAQVQHGLQLHHAGQLAEAEAIYRQVLAIQPDHPEALHLLGYLFYQHGQHELAVEWISKAIAADPTQPLYFSNLGIVWAALGNTQEAIHCHRRALVIQPDFYSALCNLGNALTDAGEREEGLACYRRALEIQPDLHAGHNNLGNALQGNKQWEEAILCYKRALEIKPDYLEAYNNMGFALQALGRFDEAIACCQQALAIRPDYHEAYCNIGNALQAQGKTEEAIASYRRALEVKPDYRDAYNNMGNTLLGQGKLEEAVACYRRALEISPDLYDAHNNLGNALQELGKLDEAVASYRRAIALKPGYCGALNNLGFALLDQGQLEEAISCYQQALDLTPDDPNKHSAVLHQMLHICDWRGFQERYDRMIKLFNAGQKNVIPFVFLSLPTTPEEQRKCAELYIQERVPPAIHGHLSASRHYDPQPARLKIGYLSGDYQNHPVAYMMAELFDLHDRNRFEITAYSYGEDDGRDMRQRIMVASDHFVDLRPLDYEAAAQRILADGIHILIEMNGFTKGVRMQIPALHPAPIQVAWLGYAGTFGAPYLEYILTDPFVTPHGYESHFTEKVVRLPTSFMPNDRKRAIQERLPTRQECGLPETGFIFVNFNKTYKINTEIFDIWMRLMRQLPGSVLWMREYNPWALKNLRREAEARGVDSSRLIFAHLAPTVTEHLARYRIADLAIDCFPYTSHSTGVDTLWAGCPLVTYIGKTFASRVAGSLLTNLNLPELVTTSLEEYEQRILELAQNPEQLANIRRRLQEGLGTAPMFDSLRFTMGMEAAYEAMWQRFQAGLVPDHIDVPAIVTTSDPYLQRKASADSQQASSMATSAGETTTATVQVEPVIPLTQLINANCHQDLLTVPLFANSVQRAVRKELEVLELIDVAGKLSANNSTQHLPSELYRVWLVHNPGNPLAYAIFFNYGVLLFAAKKLEAAKTVINEAIRLHPDFYPAYINLGNVYEQLGSPAEAVASWQRLVDRLPAIKADALGYKLSALKQIGRVGGSPEIVQNALQQSLEIKPDQRDILQQWINVRRGQCLWPLIQPWSHLTKTQLKKGFAPLSLSAYTDDPMWQLANACMYNKYEYSQPEMDFWDNHAALLHNRTSDRLKIGYLSSDIREHAIGYLTAEIFSLHNRERVEIFIYYVGHAVSDHIQGRAKATTDHWRDATGMADSDLAHLIANDKIDILVDLNGHTQGARPKVLATRPAPIIVNWLGFPGTMGSPYHNYIIADDFIIPKEYEIYYSEKVMRLPCYQPNDRQRLVADQAPSRQEEGLPEDGMVFSCLNGVQKITPYAWGLWMKILPQVPNSVLWLLTETDAIRGRLQELAAQHGVAPERLVFARRRRNFEHVPRFGLSDLGLDSTPYGSHTTASDGLWAGVPILTLPGISFASRVCGSLVKAAGLGDLICSSPEEYVERAVDFGKNKEKLQPYRQKLTDHRSSSVLFDTPSLVAHLEELYEQMWEDFKRGNLPRPDLSNLDLYQEIGIELDDDGVGRTTDPEYRALYQEKLIKKDRYCFIRGDCRLWPSK